MSSSAPRPLRCGIVVPSLPVGGLEEAVAILATTLPAFAIETSVLCTDAGGPIAERLMRAGIPVAIGKGSPRTWRGWAKRFEPDVLSTHFVSLKGVAALCDSAPIVETVHNTYVWFTPLEWQDERAKCALLRSVIPVSETVAAYYRRGCGNYQSSVIPNGVDGARITSVPRAQARKRLGMSGDDVVLVQVGRFCLQKNQVGLIDVLADVLKEDARLRLILVGGQGDTTYVDQVTSRAGTLIARGAVRLLPATPEPGIVLSAADAFVANSFFEGWSLAATEALWLGRPVILSDCGGSRELIGDDGARGILVPNPAGDPTALNLDLVRNPPADAMARNRDALRRAVHAFVADREAWSSRSADIIREARARWSAHRMAESYAAMLRRAAHLSARA